MFFTRQRFTWPLVLGIIWIFLPKLPALAQDLPEVEFLKNKGIAADSDSLTKYLRQFIPNQERQAELQKLVPKLERPSLAERNSAMEKILWHGQAALPLLEKLRKNQSAEMQQRAEILIRKIQHKISPEIESAVLRVLSRTNPQEALPLLMDYWSHAGDLWIQNEALDHLGKLASQNKNLTAQILAAAKSDANPTRQAAAAYLLGRLGDLKYRSLLRNLLGSNNTQVRQMVVQGLLGKKNVEYAKTTFSSDDQLLQQNKIYADGPGILDFLRSRTLSAKDQNQLQYWIDNLGHRSYRIRSVASQNLIRRGPPSLPFLRQALLNPKLEVHQRALICIQEIKKGPGPALSTAAIRLLTKNAPPQATEVLLDYIPFADDQQVYEEILNALCLLNLQSPVINPQLVGSLKDSHPARRGAAAYTLGKVGTEAECLLLPSLLNDPDSMVRFRSAMGLLAANDPRSIPTLIRLVEVLPENEILQIEDVLRRLAGEKANLPNITTTGSKNRAKAIQAWTNWWKSHGNNIDLTLARSRERYLGLLTICEYDSRVGKPGGRVYECDRNGKTRWVIGNLSGPMDAQVLPNGRVLIAENSARRITERDLTGKIHWEYALSGNPISCQRLGNGNIFIATYNQLMEISPTKKVVYSHNQGAGFYIFSARKLRNGKILCMSAQGKLMVVDSPTGKTIHSLTLGNSGWCGAEMLPNGRYLIAQMAQGQIKEIDATGKVFWKCTLPGGFRATRLPNGNTLAASMTQRKIVEFDRGGNIRWEKTCNGRPWNVSYR